MSEVQAWRLCAAEHAATAFSGLGARQFGGRWSSPGLPAVYCSESRALAAMEVLAHVDEPARLTGRPWAYISATFPAALIEKPPRVPESWRKYPHAPETQAFGSVWLRAGRSAVLRLPSAMVPGEFNYLLNPLHPDFSQVKIGPPELFQFDPRLA